MKTNKRPEKKEQKEKRKNKGKEKNGFILLEKKECTKEPKRRVPSSSIILK